MKTGTLEVDTMEVQGKSFPGWLRKYDLMGLVGLYVPGWQGPEPRGWHVLHASTIHEGATIDSPGMTLWILGRSPEQRHLFAAERWQEGAEYIMARIGRPSHTPKKCYTNYIVRGIASPGNN